MFLVSLPDGEHSSCNRLVGFYHEQSRPDRDSYLTVNYANIETGKVGDRMTLHVRTAIPSSYRSTISINMCGAALFSIKTPCTILAVLCITPAIHSATMENQRLFRNKPV